MPKFVEQTADDEDIAFIVFGKENVKGKDDSKAIIIEKGESFEGLITDIKDSSMWKKVFVLKLKDEERPVILLPKTDLLDKLGHGNLVTDLVADVNDFIRITYEDCAKTQKGRNFYTFKVAIAKA